MEDLKRESIKVRIFDQPREHTHFHQDYELIYVLDGSVQISITSEDFTKEAETINLKSEDLYMINANKRHSLILDKEGLLCKIFVSYDLLSQVMENHNPYFLCDSTSNQSEIYEELRLKIKKLLTHYVNTDAKVQDFGHISLCYELLDCLVVNFMLTGDDKLSQKNEGSFEERIGQINNYVRANYKSDMSLSDLASKLYLSEAYLSRFFKKNYGMSFVKYVNNIRLNHAMEQIVETDLPITKIAYENGFSNATIFNKNFKMMFGETPSQYRKLNKKKSEQISNPTEERLKSKIEAFFISQLNENDELSKKKDIVDVKCNINNKKYQRINDGGGYAELCINAGSAEEMLNSAIREHITLLKQNIDFKYVRIWDLFNTAIIFSFENEAGVYNFSRLDSSIDFILENGMKPILEFGAKPKKVQKNVQTPIQCVEDEDLKYDPISWGKMVSAFIDHLINYFGEEEVNLWIIELWNDERGSRVENYDYVKVFNQTADIVRSRGLETKVGGFGVRGDLPAERITAILKEWYDGPQKPDFVSLSHFPYESGEIKNDLYSRRSTDADAFYHMVKKIRSCMNDAGMPKDLPLSVCEWNGSISDRNFINDSCHRAAYIVKNYLQVMNEVRSVCFFRASDRSSEYYDTRGIVFGGTGLMTRNSIYKPAAFAFEFLSRLKSNIVAIDDNYIITKDSKDSLIIVCHNMKNLNYSFYLLPEGDARKEDIWKYFEDSNNLKIDFHINGYDEGEYKAKISRVNEESGSILSIWRSLGFDYDLTKKDMKFCANASEPELSILKISCTEGTLNFPITLKANEICCIHIKNTHGKERKYES